MSPTRERIDTGVWTKRAKRRAWVCAIGAVMVMGGTVGASLSKGSSLPHDLAALALNLIPGRPFAQPVRGWHLVERAWMWQTDGEWHCALQSTASSDMAWARAREAGARPIDAACFVYLTRSGLWGITHEHNKAWITIYSDTHSQDSNATRAMNDIFAERMRAESIADIEAEFPGIVATGTWTQSKVLWLGWVINAATIAGLSMFACTVRGAVRDVRAHRRALLLLRDHRCASCGYDIRGLPEGPAVCPECGKGFRDA